MPSGIFVNGTLSRRPGVSAQVDASSLGGAELTTNALAILGDFPDLPGAVPTRYNTSGALKASFPTDLVQTIAKVVYSPSNDAVVSGQPSAVYLVNTGTSTPAVITLDDGANPAIKFTAKRYGSVGNTGIVSLATPGGGLPDDRDFSITLDGTTETFSYKQRSLFSLQYTGTDATVATLDVRDTDINSLKITQSRSAIGSGPLALATGSWKWDDEPIFLASASGNHSLNVKGIRKDNGAVFDSTLTFTASASPDSPLGFDVSAITALTWTPDTAETLTVSGLAFDLSLDDPLSTVKDVVDLIGSYSAEGWSAISVDPANASIPSASLDKVTAGQSLIGSAFTLTADLYLFAQLLASSALVDVELLDGAVSQLASFTGSKPLAGGSFVGTDLTSLGTALTALRKEDVQIISSLLSSLAGSDQAVRDHCNFMAGIGSGERNAWTGVDSTAKTSILGVIKGINSRHVSVATQSVTITDATGATRTLPPSWQGLILAAMQASTPPGTPLTRKRPNVLAVVSDPTWDGDVDAEEMLAGGAVFFTNDRLGLRVERSLTSYLTDDNPVFSEMSANESLNTSIRDLRQNLETLIGGPGVAETQARIQALAKARLRFQVENDIIKAFNPSSLSVDDLGDLFRVNVEIAVIEPINFIQVNALVTRTPFGA